MTLFEEIQAKCTQEEIDTKDFHAIAAKVNINRTKPKKTSLGNGTILAVLGLEAGNNFLDVVNAAAPYRHVKGIIARGEFDLSEPVAQAGVQGMVPTYLTQEQADSLLNLAKEPDFTSWEACRTAIEQGA